MNHVFYPNDPTPYEDADSYRGNIQVRRAGSRKTLFTQELLDEYNRCRDDIKYFTSKYMKILSLDEGVINFQGYPYQKKMWDTFDKNRFSITLAVRQSGKTTGVIGYLVHSAIFKPDQNIAIVAHLLNQAQEILERFTMALEHLPFFLQPGCRKLNKRSIDFDNNTSIFVSSSRGSALRGKSISILYLDEFAFFEDDVEFMRGTYPVISSGKKSKIIITSTANGLGNQFYKIWNKAINNQGDYVPFEVNWWDVPGRDEEWKRKTIENTSLQQFEVEFNNKFLGSADTLIDGKVLQSLHHIEPLLEKDGIRVFEHPVEAGITYYDRQEKIQVPQFDSSYLMTVDVAKGRGKDYSTFTIWDITEAPYKQVCTFKDSHISPLQFPEIIVKYARIYNNAVVVIEQNDQGLLVGTEVYQYLEYDNVFFEVPNDLSRIGIFVDKKVRTIGCSNLKDLIETGNMQIVDENAIEELHVFERNRSGKFEAAKGFHDDLVANMFLFAWFAQTDTFKRYSSGAVKLSDMLRGEEFVSSSPEYGDFDSERLDVLETMIAQGYEIPDFDIAEDLVKNRGYEWSDFNSD